MNALSMFRFLVVIFLMSLAISGCTTSNQQALGVGVEPAPKTASAPAEATTPQNGEATAALAPATSDPTPAESAASSVAAADASKENTTVLARVGFLPVTGAPQRTVTDLSRSLSKQSKLHRIEVAGSNDQSAQYRLKGYMSALNEGTSTTVTFYWDVLDKSGSRLYRINGFERENGASADPWAGVSRETTARIASRTMNELAGWLKRKGA